MKIVISSVGVGLHLEQIVIKDNDYSELTDNTIAKAFERTSIMNKKISLMSVITTATNFKLPADDAKRFNAKHFNATSYRATPLPIKKLKSESFPPVNSFIEDAQSDALESERASFYAGLDNLQKNLLLGIRESIEIDSVTGRPLDESDLLLGTIVNDRWDQS